MNVTWYEPQDLYHQQVNELKILENAMKQNSSSFSAIEKASCNKRLGNIRAISHDNDLISYHLSFATLIPIVTRVLFQCWLLFPWWYLWYFLIYHKYTSDYPLTKFPIILIRQDLLLHWWHQRFLREQINITKFENSVMFITCIPSFTHEFVLLFLT